MNDDAVNGWLKKADNELNRAQNCASGLDVDGACYNSQQSIEKALKAALVFENINPPYVHDLENLCDLLPDGWSVKSTPYNLERISVWNVTTRYPIEDDGETLDGDDVSYGLSAAQDICNSIKNEINRRRHG